MELEDTVIDMHNPQIMPEIYYPQQELLRRQAGISFKAGIREVVDYLVSDDNGLQIELKGDKWGKQLEEWGINED